MMHDLAGGGLAGPICLESFAPPRLPTVLSMSVSFGSDHSARPLTPRSSRGWTWPYHAVRYRLGLKDAENSATLSVAKEIINLACEGERDPERLTTEVLWRLQHVLPRSPEDYRKFARWCRDMSAKMPEYRRKLTDLAIAWEAVANESQTKAC